MKKLIIIGMFALCIGISVWSIGCNEKMNCSNGVELTIKQACNLVAPDFPKEFRDKICSIPFSQGLMENYPLMISYEAMSGTPFDQIIYIWFVDIIEEKAVGFMECDQVNKKIITVWISEYAPEGFGKYIQEIVEEINKNNSESF